MTVSIYITIIGVAYSFLGGAGSSGTTVSPVVGLLSIGTPPSVWSVDDHTLSWNDGKQGNRTMVDSYIIHYYNAIKQISRIII